ACSGDISLCVVLQLHCAHAIRLNAETITPPTTHGPTLAGPVFCGPGTGVRGAIIIPDNAGVIMDPETAKTISTAIDLTVMAAQRLIGTSAVKAFLWFQAMTLNY